MPLAVSSAAKSLSEMRTIITCASQALVNDDLLEAMRTVISGDIMRHSQVNSEVHRYLCSRGAVPKTTKDNNDSLRP